MKSSFLLSLVIGVNFFLTACAGVNQASAVKQDPPVFNDKVIRSGREEAQKIGRNLIPIAANKQGTIAVAPGTGIRFQNSQIILLDEGNMIFNAGEYSFNYAGINLMPGEYGIVQNGVLLKSGNLPRPAN